MDLTQAANILANPQSSDPKLEEVYNFLYNASRDPDTFYRGAQGYFYYDRTTRCIKPEEKASFRQYLIRELETQQRRGANAELGITLINIKESPNAAPLSNESEHIVPRLEAFLQTATLTTVNYLSELAELLDKCADWIESLREPDFDEALSAVVLLQRAAKRSDLSKQAEILANAKDIMSTLTDLYLALKAPTGDNAILEKGLTGNATADEILAAAKILGKYKEIQALLAGKTGVELGVAKIKAKQALRDARDKKK